MPPPEPPPKKSNKALLVTLSVCGGLFALFILIAAIAAIASGGDDDTESADRSTTSSATSSSSPDAAPPASEGESNTVACKDAGPDDSLDTQNTDLYAGRPDTQSEDHEAVVGDCVRFQGYTAYVTAAATESELGEFGGDPITVTTVTVENRDDSAQPYNLFDWSLQTPTGQVIDPTIYLGEGGLSSGSLIKGGTVTGKIAFDAPAGQYYVIYKPDAFDSARGIWQITS